jgi:hypothetical protein
LIPSYFFLGLDFVGFIIFSIIQTLLNQILLNLLLYLGFWLFIKDNTKIDRKDILLTSLIIELCNFINSFVMYLFIYTGLFGILLFLLIFFMFPFIILYLRYYEKDKISERKIFLLYFVSIPASFIISIVCTSIILNLLGFQNRFLFFTG